MSVASATTSARGLRPTPCVVTRPITCLRALFAIMPREEAGHAARGEQLAERRFEDDPAVVRLPSEVQHAKVEVLLEHRLERLPDGALLCVEVRVELVGARRLEVLDDRRRVGHALAVDLDEGQLLARRLAHVSRDDLVRLIGEAEVRLDLHHERARVGQAERRTELVDLDHARTLLAFDLARNTRRDRRSESRQRARRSASSARSLRPPKSIVTLMRRFS